MPVITQPTDRFDPAIDRLRAVSGGNADGYIADHKLRCIDDAQRLAALRPGGRILNVGGRPYLFEYIARELSLDVTTLDLAPGRNTAELADLGLDVREVDFENADARARVDLANYDLICMAEIFEHLRVDLPGMFRDIASRMRSDALVYVTTPNFYYAASFLKMLASGRSGPSLTKEWGKLEQIGHMGHVREYARGELAEFFRSTGFAVADFFARTRHRSPAFKGSFAQFPFRLLANVLATRTDRFAQELVFILRPERT